MDGPAHLLSLKVMRVSRPTLASAWQPFYSSSPSFSAHSTASVLSLQGQSPLPGHPKTLRDLTHATELLTLPSSFGSIQLGETFSSCLCVNNEASVDVDAVGMKVEMQTATSKILLANFAGTDFRLGVGGTLENIVNHEIKELGQHVLACTVTYRSPPNSRAPPAEEATGLQTFRKFYKFAVTNPLSVKTKVHPPKSPSALLSSTERHKLFLEVHIQNLTQESMWFERMRFECVDGWQVEDEVGETESIFSGSTALMQPQDMRQYIYILQPTTPPSSPVVHAPGSVIALGRLDISWRSSFGEPGRLLTSMLSRRIPLPPPPTQTPVSALPPYMKRQPSVASLPSRPRSPQSRPETPSQAPRPGSPFGNRVSVGQPVRPQSPVILSKPPATLSQALASTLAISSSVHVDLVVEDIPRGSITVETPFTISFALTISVSVPPQRRRVLSLAVQHVQPPRTLAAAPTVSTNPPPEAFSPRLPSSGLSTPPASTNSRSNFNYALAHQKLLLASPRLSGTDIGEAEGPLGADFVALPRPFPEGADELNFVASTGVAFLGSSALVLDPISLSESTKRSVPGAETRDDDKSQFRQNFELTYLPLRTGFLTVGGLRLLLLEDKILSVTDSEVTEEKDEEVRRRSEARTLKEWDIIGEIWVKT